MVDIAAQEDIGLGGLKGDRVGDHESERYTTNNNKLGGFKGIPVPNLLVSPDESPERYLETVDREKLEFRLGPTATEDGSTYTLRPFFELNRNRYIVYWPTKE